MTVNIELLKLLGAIFALVVSTATVQFKIADFVNKKRDDSPERRKGRLSTFGEIYDWAWGYVLGILVNSMFFVIAIVLRKTTICTQFALIGTALFVLYLVNLIGWVAGFVIDGFRHKYPGEKRCHKGTVEPVQQ